MWRLLSTHQSRYFLRRSNLHAHSHLNCWSICSQVRNQTFTQPITFRHMNLTSQLFTWPPTEKPSFYPSCWSCRFMWPGGTNVQDYSSCEPPAVATCSAFHVIPWILNSKYSCWKKKQNLLLFFFRTYPSDYWDRLFLVYALIFIHESQIVSCTMIHFFDEVEKCLFVVCMLHSKTGMSCYESAASLDEEGRFIHRCKFWMLITVQFRQENSQCHC